MEFLHTYGVKVNSADAKGRTALHVAAANDDVDGVCRLMEWGADVNIKDGNPKPVLAVFWVKKKVLGVKKDGTQNWKIKNCKFMGILPLIAYCLGWENMVNPG